ncbi:AAA domain-containing protein [Prevotella aurantiaca JCM 15754]|uniref:DEAD/DEAH box helicase n=1 Tax=Prevotella aurantiaca TaxID=596085 RepID=UPI00046AFA50|nr:AAA domain-containing protein [Prevotella aurantiaca]
MTQDSSKAQELFARILEVIEFPDNRSDMQNRLMHETLVLACHEGLKGTRHGFGNLSSQVDSLCKQFHIKPQDTVAIHLMRRHSNSIAPILHNDLLYDCRALALFISAVFNTSIPSFLVGKIPTEGRRTANIQIANYKYIRCTVQSWDDKYIKVNVLNQECGEEEVLIDYINTPEHIDLSYIRKILCEGMQLNLLDCNVTRKRIVPRIIVVEPDFLVDISSIANCFEDYGHHPLLFTVNRLQSRKATAATLLGNFAGKALDDIINNPNYNINETLKSNFRNKALDFATCTDFNSDVFKKDGTEQAKNIQDIVEELFKNYDRNKAILEPSFVCESLGIQGRVDLMTTDFRLLVEQKSGKNFYIASNHLNNHGSKYLEKHYVQVLLYFGILQYNFNRSTRNTNIHLLYSKYPLPNGLLEVESLQSLMMEAIKFRNQVVATEYWIGNNDFAKIIPHFTPNTLQLTRGNESFFQQWILPRLTETLAPLHKLSPLETAYFSRMMRFVVKEQIISKVGYQEGTGSSNADLWNMPLAGKIESGNIYTGLTITRKEQSTAYSGYDSITLAVPKQSEDFLPNFRRGDMVYLYAYRKNEIPDIRKAFLFRGTLQEIHTNTVMVRLNDGQQNPNLLVGDQFAIEHSGSDIGCTTAIQGLHTFITASKERKDLLLGQRSPERNTEIQLSKTYNPTYDDIILRAKQATDYFLLIGPPGTGKTSMALQYLVREHEGKNILLLSYTNRAVDEICGMLADNNIAFLRLSKEYSCDSRFTDNLLNNAVKTNPTLEHIRQTIESSRIIVSTTASLAIHTAIFSIKHFELAIIDEASQILEPNIVGLLAAHNGGKQVIDKFILIGDHKQLPAVVQQDNNESAADSPLLEEIHLPNCANSLFERLILTERAAGRNNFVGTLRKQGRMHPDIATFPNTYFYVREQLECVPLAHQTELNLPYNKPSEDKMDDFLKAHRMIFIPSKLCRQPNISEKVNTEEARIVANLVRRLYRQMGETFDAQKSIGIIVPYRNQIAMIRKELEQLQLPDINNISIDTVERYQGSQRDVIIYSFTIQNRFQLEFLTANTFIEDGNPIDRKLNVAITRARQQLILTGNEATLRQNFLFGKLIDYIDEKGGRTMI